LPRAHVANSEAPRSHAPQERARTRHVVPELRPMAIGARSSLRQQPHVKFQSICITFV